MGNFGNLPSEIMLDIFTRLPTESVSESKLVCKTWRNVVRLPSFCQIHSNILLKNLQSSSDCGKISFILTTNDVSKRLPEEFHYLEYDNEVSSLIVKKMNFSSPFDMYSFLGSCNGLICLKGLPRHYSLSKSSTASYVPYICNPITKEVLTLPELDRKTYYDIVEKMFCGFGYVASTNEYKVVRMYTFKTDRKVAQIDVYTLGSGKGWRDAGKHMIDKDQDFTPYGNAVFASGFLFWNFGNGRTGAYDLASENFAGYCEFSFGHLWRGVLGGHLYGKQYSEDGKSSDIWLLKKNEDESFGWCKEFSLISTDSYNAPFAFTSNGTVLGYAGTKLYHYDPKATSSKVLEDFGRTICCAIPHMNTLVSLKAFGEENVR